jgi:hypothetical protein
MSSTTISARTNGRSDESSLYTFDSSLVCTLPLSFVHYLSVFLIPLSICKHLVKWNGRALTNQFIMMWLSPEQWMRSTNPALHTPALLRHLVGLEEKLKEDKVLVDGRWR